MQEIPDHGHVALLSLLSTLSTVPRRYLLSLQRLVDGEVAVVVHGEDDHLPRVVEPRRSRDVEPLACGGHDGGDGVTCVLGGEGGEQDPDPCSPPIPQPAWGHLCAAGTALASSEPRLCRRCSHAGKPLSSCTEGFADAGCENSGRNKSCAPTPTIAHKYLCQANDPQRSQFLTPQDYFLCWHQQRCMSHAALFHLLTDAGGLTQEYNAGVAKSPLSDLQAAPGFCTFAVGFKC